MNRESSIRSTPQQPGGPAFHVEQPKRIPVHAPELLAGTQKLFPVEHGPMGCWGEHWLTAQARPDPAPSARGSLKRLKGTASSARGVGSPPALCGRASDHGPVHGPARGDAPTKVGGSPPTLVGALRPTARPGGTRRPRSAVNRPPWWARPGSPWRAHGTPTSPGLAGEGAAATG